MAITIEQGIFDLLKRNLRRIDTGNKKLLGICLDEIIRVGAIEMVAAEEPKGVGPQKKEA